MLSGQEPPVEVDGAAVGGELAGARSGVAGPLSLLHKI